MSKPVDNVNHIAMRPGEEIADEIHAIRHLFKQRRYRGQSAGDHELSHMEGRVVFFIGSHPGASQSEIAAYFRRDKAQIARLIAILRKSGLVEWRGDAEDKRLQRMFLTERGSALHDEARRERKRLARQAVAGFDASERETLMRLLGRIRANLEVE
jgi:DNA-binding MarR family transcriptional regulator